MKIDYVLIISPDGYTHSQALYDVAMGFSQSLKELGHRAELIVDPSKQSLTGYTLLFGAHLIPRHGGVLTEGNYIVYQSEQVPTNLSDSGWFTEGYLKILSAFPVWDYSSVNVDNLEKHNIISKHVPIGYHERLSNIPRHESVTLCGGGKSGKQRIDYADWSGEVPQTLDVDVAFFGSMNERRQKIIDELRGHDLVVVTPTSYGAHRDKIISRSKVLLNMHFYDTAIFEIARCGHYFANSKAVVSEYGLDKELETPFYECTEFASYDGLVQRVLDLVSDSTRRRVLEVKSLDTFSQILQVDILKRELE